MTSRREFLEHIGWTGMGWTMVPLASALPADRPVPLHAVLMDGQYPQARDFGIRCARIGAPVRITDGEITDLWLREIEPVWKRRPVALAGLTASPTLFCLEQLAWAHGLRVAFHAEHVLLPQRAVHSVHRCDAALAPVDEHVLASAGADWSERIAGVFESYNQSLPITAAGPSCAGLEPAMPSGASLLTSWIIAPT